MGPRRLRLTPGDCILLNTRLLHPQWIRLAIKALFQPWICYITALNAFKYEFWLKFENDPYPVISHITTPLSMSPFRIQTQAHPPYLSSLVLKSSNLLSFVLSLWYLLRDSGWDTSLKQQIISIIFDITWSTITSASAAVAFSHKSTHHSILVWRIGIIKQSHKWYHVYKHSLIKKRNLASKLKWVEELWW